MRKNILKNKGIFASANIFNSGALFLASTIISLVAPLVTPLLLILLLSTL